MSELVKGLYWKEPKENAPNFVKGNLAAKRVEFLEFLNGESGEWVNMQLLESKAGKLYFAVDDWKPASNDETVKIATPKNDDPLLG